MKNTKNNIDNKWSKPQVKTVSSVDLKKIIQASACSSFGCDRRFGR